VSGSKRLVRQAFCKMCPVDDSKNNGCVRVLNAHPIGICENVSDSLHLAIFDSATYVAIEKQLDLSLDGTH
jgi:hypothetical protein